MQVRSFSNAEDIHESEWDALASNPYERRGWFLANQKLYKESVYNKLWFEEVSAKAVIRNDAAHGKYDSYGPEDVRGLIQFSKRLLAEFLQAN